MAFFSKKTWKDRVTEYPTRRTLTKSDGSTELVTVSRSEGNVSQEGDAFNAATMNDLESRVESGFDAVNNDLDQCSFERKEDGVYINYTPLGGADAVSKKLGSGGIVSFTYLGAATVTVLINQGTTTGNYPKVRIDVSAYNDGPFIAICGFRYERYGNDSIGTHQAIWAYWNGVGTPPTTMDTDYYAYNHGTADYPHNASVYRINVN